MTRPTLALGALLTAALLALSSVLSGALTGAASAASAASAATGWVRVGHLSPGTPKAEVSLTPFEGGQARTLTEASFGDLSDYERVPVGLYTVSLTAADQPGAEAMLSRSVEITEGGARTVIATGRGDDVRATVLDDDLTPPAAGQAKVRLISAAVEPDAISAQVVDGPTLTEDLTAGSATGYAEVPAQEWRIRLAAGDGGSADQNADQSAAESADESSVAVRAGGVYTLVALDSPAGGLELRAVRDSGGSTGADGAMPSGGVDTGAGGLAAPTADGAWAPLAGGALLAVLLGTVLALRRRGSA